MSVFNPLLFIVVAILSWMLLQEKLYVGTCIYKLLLRLFPLESYQQVPTCCFVVNYSVVFYVSVVGSVLIVMGLYTVIWGKKRATKAMSNGGDEREENPEAKGDQEMQCSEIPNGSLQTKRLAKKWNCKLVLLEKI